jgi:hypothetical protein
VKQLYKSKAMQKRGRHVAAHTYSPSAEVAVERLRKVRKAMPKRGDITVTEHGWATCPKPTITKQRKCVTPARQKAQMKEYIRLLEERRRSLDVLGFYWFQAMDFSYPEIVEDCPDDPKNFFGIWTRNGEAKPSHQAWETLSGVDLPETVAQNPLGTRPCQDRN